ncbi:DNA-processing protein DprA [Beijerinckia sp. L45]|uniref:DNA-processing protein DprA n=1 Tax=Beijerinckia sp. L45 TaxID=1641855 RepID=UPI00131AADC4|nr:DNA-processing protein DprA [Beijerinckia sp. L45]
MNFLSSPSSFGPAVAPISPLKEMGAYEALWLEQGATFKTIADRFAADPDAMPSDFVATGMAESCAVAVLDRFRKASVGRFGVRLHHAGDYPLKLRDARHPVEMLYYCGEWELTETRCVAIVGSRKASEEGLKRAAQISRELVKADFTVVSGLAAGIDRAAHTAALEAGGRTIAVIGTPLDSIYPKENRDLQDQIARDFLLISQVPVLRYARQAPPQNRLFFPERNVTMSALTDATIIVEASDTSGTLTQARAAMHQGRHLFILNSCFERADLKWPAKFEEMGAIRVRSMDDIWSTLCPTSASA